MSSQQLDHHALVRRIEMLDHDEGHAAVGRERVEEFLKRIEAAGRSADANHREVAILASGSAARHPAAAQAGDGGSRVDPNAPASPGHFSCVSSPSFPCQRPHGPITLTRGMARGHPSPNRSE